MLPFSGGLTLMAISLYDVSVASYLQVLGGVSDCLAQGRAHCEANDVDLESIVQTRLFDDMWPFHDQVVSVAHHSLGCIRGLQAGLFQPPNLEARRDYAGLQILLDETTSELGAITPEVVNALEGGELKFRAGKFELQFVAEDFVTSFSLPNFYFHATTAYDMLRMQGVPIGKLNFVGKLRVTN